MQLAINEFIEEQRKGLSELLASVSKSRVDAARSAARESAARIKDLNGRIRALARSGVRLTTVSQGAVQSLIELHEDIVTSALGEAANQLQKMAYTESVRDLARMQADVLQSARQRIVADMSRAVSILKGAAGDARKAVERAEAPAKPAQRRKAAGKKKAKKTRARAKTSTKTKARAKAKAKVKARAKGKSRNAAKGRARAKRTARKTRSR